MAITNDDIKKIAHLARLSIADADIPSYAKKLTNVFELAQSLSSVEIDHLEPMAHPLNINQRLRADEIIEVDQHQKYQAIAPKVEVDLYLVPKVIE